MKGVLAIAIADVVEEVAGVIAIRMSMILRVVMAKVLKRMRAPLMMVQ
jgi:hypothetical protein